MGPLPGCAYSPGFIIHPCAGSTLIPSVLSHRIAQKPLNAEQKHSDVHRRGPARSQGVKGNSPHLVYIWVVDLCQKPHLRRDRRVVFWQDQLKLECTTVVARLRRTLHHHFKISQVGFSWYCNDPTRWVTDKPLRFFDDSSRQVGLCHLCHQSLPTPKGCAQASVPSMNKIRFESDLEEMLPGPSGRDFGCKRPFRYALSTPPLQTALF